MMEILSYLVRSCHGSTSRGELPPSPLQIGEDRFAVPLDPEEQKVVFDRKFISRVLKDGSYPDELSEIVLFWSWENKAFSESVSQILKDGITVVADAERHLGILSPLIKMKDSIHGWREDTLLPALIIPMMHDSVGRKDVLDLELKFLITLAQESQAVQQWMFNSKEAIHDILKESGWEKKRIDQIFH